MQAKGPRMSSKHSPLRNLIQVHRLSQVRMSGRNVTVG